MEKLQTFNVRVSNGKKEKSYGQFNAKTNFPIEYFMLP